jgi:CubicO group peptidase (beta-lactamase class C family)
MRSAKLSRSIVVSLLIYASAVSSSKAGEPPRSQEVPSGFDPVKLAQIDTLFQDHVAGKQIAGAVALVARHGKVAYLKAFGSQDVEAGTPMSTKTIFRIASMSKAVTSTAVMILADQGRIDISDPVSRYLPEFKFMQVAKAKPKADGKTTPEGSAEDYDLVAAYRPITIRDLLTHTSGLCYRFRNHPLVGRKYADADICDGLTPSDHSLAENVRRLAGIPLANQPGTAWEYGLSTDVLGRLVEVVSGQPLEAFFTERIFNPLKMNDTHFVLPEAKRNRLAALYEPGPDGKIVRAGEGPTVKGTLIYSASLPYQGTKGHFSGGAGLVSTAGDYARFLQMLLNGGELEGARILRRETVAAMTRDQIGALPMWIPVHGFRFGFGFGINTSPGTDPKKDPVDTFGWGGIYYTDFWVDPKHEVVGVMMTQIYPSDRLKLRDLFHRLVNEAVQTRPAEANAR